MTTRFDEPLSTANATDLSSEIADAVERLPDDRVQCRQVGADLYRCVWWSPSSSVAEERNDPAWSPRPEVIEEHGYTSGLGGAESRVRRNCLFLATKPAGELLIRQVAAGSQSDCR